MTDNIEVLVRQFHRTVREVRDAEINLSLAIDRLDQARDDKAKALQRLELYELTKLEPSFNDVVEAALDDDE